MDCRKAREELSAGPAAAGPFREHLDGCVDCRRFAADLEDIRSMTRMGIQTPVSLRESTLERCIGMLDGRSGRVRPPVLKRFRRALDSPSFVAASATLGLLILGIYWGAVLGDSPDASEQFFVKFTFIQIAAQNIAAAMFLPALVLLRSGPSSKSRLRQT